MRSRSSVMRACGGFDQRLRSGRVLRARRRARHRRPWRPCRLRRALLRRRRARRRPGRARHRRCRWRRAALLRLSAMASGTASAAASSSVSSSRRRSSSSICVDGGGRGALPSVRVRRRSPRGAARDFAVALQAVERGARFAVGGARFGGRGRAHRRRLCVSATPSPSSAELGFRLRFGFQRGVARLRETADFGFERGQLRGAFGGGARRLGRGVLRGDERLFGVALVLFGRAGGFARRVGGVAWRRNRSRRRRRGLPCAASISPSSAARRLRCDSRTAAADGASAEARITVPAPQIAARRNQTLARLQMPSAAPCPDRGTRRRSSRGGAQRRRALRRIRASGFAPAGSGAASSNAPRSRQ